MAAAHFVDDVVTAQSEFGAERHFFEQLSGALTAAMRRLVPPRSTPMEKSGMEEKIISYGKRTQMQTAMQSDSADGLDQPEIPRAAGERAGHRDDAI